MYITCSIIYVHEHGGIWGHSAQIEGDGMFFNVSQYSTILFLVFFRGHGPKFVWMERGKSNRFIFFRRRESIQNARVNSGERKKERKRELAVVIQEWVSFLPVDILRLKREDDG